jgi:hypothetical protein
MGAFVPWPVDGQMEGVSACVKEIYHADSWKKSCGADMIPRSYDGFLPEETCTDSVQAYVLAGEVACEFIRASSMFPPIHSPHEGLAVIEEEFEEFKQEVWKFNLNKGRDTRPNMRTELIQLAAMCLRTIHDTIDKAEK